MTTKSRPMSKRRSELIKSADGRVEKTSEKTNESFRVEHTKKMCCGMIIETGNSSARYSQTLSHVKFQTTLNVNWQRKKFCAVFGNYIHVRQRLAVKTSERKCFELFPIRTPTRRCLLRGLKFTSAPKNIKMTMSFGKQMKRCEVKLSMKLHRQHSQLFINMCWTYLNIKFHKTAN